MLSPMRLGGASAMTAAVLWTICALLVTAAPGPMMTVTGHMLHAELSGMRFHLTPGGFFIGLIAWCVSAWAAGALLAVSSGMLRVTSR